MSDNAPVITIDGPSGTGKGTVSQLLAQKLGWNLLDSGALYRVLALAAKQHNVDIDNEAAIQVLAEHLDVSFKATSSGGASRVILEGDDVNEAIRTEECSQRASKVAAMPAVRQALLARQRAFANEPGLVTDGRDMGTVVFPQAELKIYLDASQSIRAERRYKQLKEKGINVNLRDVLEDLTERDRRDRLRVVAPLKPAKDAVTIDTSQMTIEQVLDRILKEAETRLGSLEVT